LNRLAGNRRWLVAGAAVAALLAGGLLFAANDARARILQALGPRATVGAISLGYPTVTLHDVRVAADPRPGAWPAAEEFEAREVAVDIDAASLWAYRRGAPLRIADIRVRDGTLVMLHTPGHLTLLPSLRDSARAAAGAVHDARVAPAGALQIAHIGFDAMAVELVDRALPDGRPHPVRFAQVTGSVANLALPGLAQPIAIDLQGALRGAERDGQVSLKGRLSPAARDADLALRLAGVDMTALQPWLLRLGERPVRHGTLDLALDARAVQGQLHAPGQLTMTGLEFADEGGTFAGVERRAVLAALRRDGRITLRFTLEGRMDDPKSVLDEHLGLRLAGGLGEAVGSGVKGVVSGVGQALHGLLGGGADRPPH